RRCANVFSVLSFLLIYSFDVTTLWSNSSVRAGPGKTLLIANWEGSAMRRLRFWALATLVAAAGMNAAIVRGQVVINELVEDEQDFESTDVSDTRDFIELYNAGNSAVDISNYTMHYYLLGNATTGGSYFTNTSTMQEVHDTIPAKTTLASHAYYV